ncbi:MAG: hypothetical protein ACJ8AD_12370, partial [Gemmatimonadaceae bacterium]
LRLDPAEDGERRRVLRAARPSRRAIAVALGVAMISGLLLFFADLEAFAVSRVFWMKMILVVLLLANGVVASRLEARLLREDDAAADHRERLWRRRRASARAAAVLWFALVLSGSALASR